MFGKKEKSQTAELDRIKRESNSGNVLNQTFSSYFSIIFKLAIGLLIIFVLIHLYNDSDGFVNVSKEYEYVEDLKNIKKPKLKVETGGTNLTIDGENVEFTYLASVDVSGRVLWNHNSLEYDFSKKISPVRLVISWGDLAKNKYSKYVNYVSSGDSGYMYYISEEAGEDASKIKNMINNNSTYCALIPASKEIKSLIKKIAPNDFIRMEGYIVNIDCNKKKGGTFSWKSSIDKSSFARGKQKLLLVTKIVWLESDE